MIETSQAGWVLSADVRYGSDLAGALRRLRMIGVCDLRAAGVDVKLPFEIAAVDVAVGIANSLRPVSSGAI